VLGKGLKIADKIQSLNNPYTQHAQITIQAPIAFYDCLCNYATSIIVNKQHINIIITHISSLSSSYGLPDGRCRFHEGYPRLSILCSMIGSCQTNVKWSIIRFVHANVYRCHNKEKIAFLNLTYHVAPLLASETTVHRCASSVR